MADLGVMAMVDGAGSIGCAAGAVAGCISTGGRVDELGCTGGIALTDGIAWTCGIAWTGEIVWIGGMARGGVCVAG